jgi:leucine dehydrogenase
MLINIEHGKYGTECLVTFKSTSPKIEGVVAIHNTKLGPAMGGCRIYEELDFESATLDAIKLAKTMSYKNAICNLPYGGGKAVIVKHKSSMTEVMTFFAKVMNLLNGTYLTTEDVGTNDKDMDFLRNYTRYALGEPIKGMPMSSAAYGVYVAIKASLFGLEGKQDLNGLKVAVQGLGKVGFKLCGVPT